MKDFFKMWTPSEAYEKLFETFQDKEDLIDERDFKRDFETWLLKKSRPCESKEDFVKKYRSKLFSRIVFFNSKRVFSELLGVAYTQIRNPDSNLRLFGRS